MTDCDPCRMLGLMPQRRDIPAHLRRQRAADVRSEGVQLKTYECAQCESLWRWYDVDGWMRSDLAEDARTPAVPSSTESYA